MARFKTKKPAKSAKVYNKIDMSLDAIVKLNNIEKTKQLKAKLKTSLQKKRQKTQHQSTALKNLTRWTREGQGRELGVSTRGRNGRLRPALLSKVTSKLGDRSQRRTTKQQSSRKFRENIVNDRRNIQGYTDKGRRRKQPTEYQQQRRQWSTKEFFTNRNERNLTKNKWRNLRSKDREYPERSFEERLQHAKANASKLTVVVKNPQAKLSSSSSNNPSALDLIRMQLNNICDVIENLPLPELETSRLQRMRSLVDNSGYPQVIPEHESSLSDEICHNYSTAGDRSNYAMHFTIQNRLDIPFTKTLPTLNERFSKLSIPIVVKCEDSHDIEQF